MTAEKQIQNQAAMRAAKKQKAKAAKIEKKAKKLDRTLVCPPDAAGRSFKMRLLGYLCRVPVMFCAVAGLGTLLNSAFRLGEDGAVVLPAALAVALLSLICYGRWYTALGGVALGGGMLAWYLSQQSNVAVFLQGVVDVGLNGIFQRLYDAGYYSYAQYQTTLTVMEEAHEAMLMQSFVALLTWIIALLFVPFLARRIRIVVPLIVSVGVMVPIFTYNLPVSNWAVTGIIAGCCALLIMWGYQRRYDRDNREGAPSELFSDMQRPALPERMRNRVAYKKEEKERRDAHRERVRQRQATGLVTVEDEINEYLDAPVRKKRPKAHTAVTGEDAAEQARRKQERAQIRAVRNYDRITRETRCAMGGVAGFCIMLLVLAVLLLPTMAVDGPFDTIDAIEHRVQYYRDYVTATLRGNDPVLEMYAYGESIRNEEPHTTTAETQIFDNIALMRVYAQFNSPIYLQGWVGVDYTDGAWATANDDQIYQWRELYDATDLPAEAMFEGFFQMMLPEEDTDITVDELYQKYFGYEKYGFVAYMVNIQRLRALGSELYLPRVTSDTLRILDYRTTTPVLQPWAVYFDGVAVSSVIDEARADYSVEAYVPLQINPDWSTNTAKLISAYNASVSEILRYEDTRNKSGFRADYMNTYVDISKNLRYSLAQSYIEQMSAAKRAVVLSDITDAQAYTNYVYDTYLDTADSEIVSALAERLYSETYADEDYLTEVDEETGLLRRVGIVDGAEPLSFSLASRRASTYADTYIQRHELTMAVINYLVENHEYSLEITTEGDPMLDGVENFLSVTKQGYCVQFASAAALLLRECGIPVRYMEGYVSADYTRRVNAGENTSRFVAEIMDSDKHAWIEVWFDGIGWVIYETTPPFYIDLYGEESTTASTIAPVIDDTPVIDPPKNEDEELPVTPIVPGDEVVPGGIDVELLIKSIILTVVIVGAVSAIVIFIIVFIRRAKRAQQKRAHLAEKIIAYDRSIFDTEEHRADAAKTLIRNTLTLLAMYGSAPRRGELRDEYAKRLSFAYEDVFGYPSEYDDGSLGQREMVSTFCIGRLLDAVAAEEFGYGMHKADMKVLAEFYLQLHRHRASRISAPRRWALRYVKRMI